MLGGGLRLAKALGDTHSAGEPTKQSAAPNCGKVNRIVNEFETTPRRQ
ncbi:hypothetical protein JCM12107_21790 [Corynebacterium simulans]|uniref:Uncharacterized protein n=1 Tax=Corynebacterium simulans TaxID=146827 RepID=A0ABR5V8A0_9CORY|nr:hypothetical protein WM41_1707 [Corynebacterium simulans]